jgi:pimeloyl-ACP methyl ester carboxylesterase
LFFIASHGYRAIAHDRRGHGRSSQPWNGNDMDTYADDLATLVEALDLRGAVLVGHSTGGGEVARYIGRHGSARVAGAVLVGAVAPLMLKTEANPGGTPIAAFDAILPNSLSRILDANSIKSVRDTRNYLTHFDARLGSRADRGDRELEALSDRLSWALTPCLLGELALNDLEISALLYQVRAFPFR